MNELTELLRPHVADIKQSALRGNKKARQVIALYRMHCDCPGDPGASGLCRAAFEEWLNSQSSIVVQDHAAALPELIEDAEQRIMRELKEL